MAEPRLQGFRLNNAAPGLPLDAFFRILLERTKTDVTADSRQEIVMVGTTRDLAGVVLTKLQFQTQWHYENVAGTRTLIVQGPEDGKERIALNFFAGRLFDDAFVGLFQSFTDGMSLSAFIQQLTKEYVAAKEPLRSQAIDEVNATYRGRDRKRKEKEARSDFAPGLHHQWICTEDAFEDAINDAQQVRSFQMVVPPDKAKLLGHGTPAGDIFQHAGAAVRIAVRIDSDTPDFRTKLISFVKDPLWKWTGRKLRERHSAEIVDASGENQHIYVALNRFGFPEVRHDDVMSDHLLSQRPDGSTSLDFTGLHSHPVVSQMREVMNQNSSYFGS